MILTFLGTSSGVPTKTRNVTGIALSESVGRAWYLIDCGEATQHQILHTYLSLNALQAIFITHVHGDHCYGLPGILASAGMAGRRDPLKIIAPSGIKEWCESTQTHTQFYLPFELEFISTDQLPTIEFENTLVTLTKLSHRVPSYAYTFEEKRVEANLNAEKLKMDGIPQGSLWGKIKNGLDAEYEGRLIKSEEYLIYNNKPGKIVISGDNDQPGLLTDSCNGCDVLVHEATFTKDMAIKVGSGVGHSYAGLVAEFAQINKVPNLVLTHFSARYQSDIEKTPSIADIYNEAKQVYKGRLFMASDFTQYKLEKSGDFFENGS
ncbi:MAG: ribonuclease Z [Candidatus Thiodiazotropha sp.]